MPGLELPDSPIPLGKRGNARQGGSRYLPTDRGRHLVLHERDERRDHEGEARIQKRRHLEADRLATSGRENGQHDPSRENGPHDSLLRRAEALESVVSSEGRHGGLEVGARHAEPWLVPSNLRQASLAHR